MITEDEDISEKEETNDKSGEQWVKDSPDNDQKSCSEVSSTVSKLLTTTIFRVTTSPVAKSQPKSQNVVSRFTLNESDIKERAYKSKDSVNVMKKSMVPFKCVSSLNLMRYSVYIKQC